MTEEKRVEAQEPPTQRYCKRTKSVIRTQVIRYTSGMVELRIECSKAPKAV